MKKKLLTFSIIAFLLSFPILAVNAKSVNIEDEDSLKTCLETDGNTCVLNEDIKLNSPISISGTVVLDLNGKKLELGPSMPAAAKDKGLLTVKNGAFLTINDETGDGEIHSGNSGAMWGAIRLTMPDDDASKVAKLVVNGGHISGYYYPIVGNGDRHNTYVEINGGIIEGLNKNDSLGIFNPQDGEVVINGGTIKGGTGIEMRVGKLTVNGGEIIGIADSLSVVKNGSGSTSVGAGVAIMQHNTGKPITVNINGGKISGIVPVFQKNIQELAEDTYKKINININGGEYKVINSGTLAIDFENDVYAVMGGTYDVEPLSKYIKTPFKVITEGQKYVVVLDSISDFEEIDPDKKVENPEMGITKESKDIIEDAFKEAMKDPELQAKVQGKDISLILDYSKKELEKTEKDAFEAKKKDLKGTVTSAGVFDINIDIYDNTEKTVIGNITELDSKITLQILLPENMLNKSKDYNREYYLLRMHDGNIDTIKAKLSDDGKSITAESDKFSSYELVYVDTEKNPETGDNIGLYIFMGLSSIAGIYAVTKLIRRKETI